jgi:dihydrofolate reductase
MSIENAPTITLVVAVASNGVIGSDGGMPWKLSGDLKRFKADTMGRPVVMGRKTWAAIGKALPGRDNIVITRDVAFKAEGAFVASGIISAMLLAEVMAQQRGADDIAIIGGGEIYRQRFDRADRLIVTHVDGVLEGDTVFPEISSETWQEIESEAFPAGEKDSHATRRVVYQRKR